MNLVYNIVQFVFAISALIVVIFDYKYQKIPFWAIIINYVSLSLLVNYFALIGIVFLVFCKIKDKPIDLLYILIMCYLLINTDMYYKIFSILICLLYVLVSSKKEKISFMVPLEIAITILIMKG